MKPKQLESLLQSLDDFEEPDITLEQYATTPHIASYIFQQIKDHYDGLDGKLVADLGCGCGSLTFGAALSDAAFCIGFDIDESALEIACRNKEDIGCENVDFVQCDVLNLGNSRWHKAFDTVIMNPPFGTKFNEGIHLRFLETAFSLARQTVYSIHKFSTLKKIQKLADSWNIKMESLYKVMFDLKNTYKFHSRKSLDIEVVVIRFILPESNKS